MSRVICIMEPALIVREKHRRVRSRRHMHNYPKLSVHQGNVNERHSRRNRVYTKNFGKLCTSLITTTVMTPSPFASEIVRHSIECMPASRGIKNWYTNRYIKICTPEINSQFERQSSHNTRLHARTHAPPKYLVLWSVWVPCYTLSKVISEQTKGRLKIFPENKQMRSFPC
jgi:hypothetical protein